MSAKTTANAVTILPPILDPDRTALEAVVARRLALRMGLSLPVAAVTAALAGLGPREARR